MFDFSSYEALLEAQTKPKDLQPSMFIQETPHDLFMKEMNLDTTFDSSKVISKNTKVTRKVVKNVWDVDIKSSGPGYFDQNGNFVLDKPKKIYTNWLVKRNNLIEGPFTEKEFKNFLLNVSSENVWVKRDSDKGFVLLDNLKNDLTLNFMTSKDLNKYFATNQVVEEHKKEDSFFDSPITNEKATKLNTFLRNYEVSASVDFIIKSIKNTRKSQAIEILQQITGLDRSVNTTLVDIIVESAGYQILSDVDKDGFYIGHSKRKH